MQATGLRKRRKMRAFYRRQKEGGGEGRAQSAPKLGSLHLVAPVAQGCAGGEVIDL